MRTWEESVWAPLYTFWNGRGFGGVYDGSPGLQGVASRIDGKGMTTLALVAGAKTTGTGAPSYYLESTMASHDPARNPSPSSCTRPGVRGPEDQISAGFFFVFHSLVVSSLASIGLYSSGPAPVPFPITAADSLPTVLSRLMGVSPRGTSPCPDSFPGTNTSCPTKSRLGAPLTILCSPAQGAECLCRRQRPLHRIATTSAPMP
jgi:hypothetical protein